MVIFSIIWTLFAGCVGIDLDLGVYVLIRLRGVEMPEAANLVLVVENLILGELPEGSSKLYFLMGRSLLIAVLISLLCLLGLFG